MESTKEMINTEDSTVSSNRSSKRGQIKDGVASIIKHFTEKKRKKFPGVEKDIPLQNKRAHSGRIDEEKHCCGK